MTTPKPRLDDLQYKGLFLYQRADLPCFSQDSVLLAAFADLTPHDRAVDLGAGTGALALLCGARTGAQFCCVEREAALCALLRQTMEYNTLRIPVYETDWAQAPGMIGYGGFTAVLCNPPYYAEGTQSPDPLRAKARGGADVFEGAAQSAAWLLKNGGRLYMSYPAGQLTDALLTLRRQGLEPKRLRLVAYDAKKPPYLALIMARRGGKPGLAVEPALLLKDETGADSAELRAIYHLDG